VCSTDTPIWWNLNPQLKPISPWRTEDGDGVVGTPPDQLLPGHSITLVKRSFTTSVLGSHTLLARVLPPFEGEARLYNNERTYQFNVTIQQYFSPGQGPNPAVSIDDIFFSNRYPKRGEEVTITVYVKNLGPSPVLPSHHLLFVMSLYPIKQLNLGENRKVLSWIDDVPEVPEGVDPQDWASSHGQSLYGNDTTFPTVKIRNFAKRYHLPNSKDKKFCDPRLRKEILFPSTSRWIATSATTPFSQ